MEERKGKNPQNKKNPKDPKPKPARSQRRLLRSLLAQGQIPVVSNIAVKVICFQKAEGFWGGGGLARQRLSPPHCSIG